jgi:putative oxidoreductase
MCRQSDVSLLSTFLVSRHPRRTKAEASPQQKNAPEAELAPWSLSPVYDSERVRTFLMNSWIDRCACLMPSLPSSWYAIPLRLIVGFGFMEHGYAKLARGPEAFTQILSALHVPMPAVMAWATILVELIGGCAVLLGLFIPLASVPMIIVLLVAIFSVHVPNGFSSIKLESITAGVAHFGQPGYETDLLYLAAIIALLVGGSGPFALDRLSVSGRLNTK